MKTIEEKFKNEAKMLSKIEAINELYEQHKELLDRSDERSLMSRIDATGLHCTELVHAAEDLVTYLDKAMITNAGQHTDMYYDACQNDYQFKVVEADSYGPLRVRFTDAKYGWCVYYG